jgi:hypothetical protein
MEDQLSIHSMLHDTVTLVKANGQRFDRVKALVEPTKIFVDDAKLPIEEGDRFQRELPNGLVEVYLVLDRGFHTGMHGIPDHYQVSVRKETSIPKRSPGPVIYNITGPNARVNINSLDQSANVVNITPANLFVELRRALQEAIQNEERQTTVLAAVAALEQAQRKPTFAQRYRDFVALVADHMAILAPFIPALTQLL